MVETTFQYKDPAKGSTKVYSKVFAFSTEEINRRQFEQFLQRTGCVEHDPTNVLSADDIRKAQLDKLRMKFCDDNASLLDVLNHAWEFGYEQGVLDALDEKEATDNV